MCGIRHSQRGASGGLFDTRVDAPQCEESSVMKTTLILRLLALSATLSLASCVSFDDDDDDDVRPVTTTTVTEEQVPAYPGTVIAPATTTQTTRTTVLRRD